MKKNKYDIPSQDTSTFNLSISDLMSGLLAIFILALCYFMLNFSNKTARITENNTKRTELIRSLQKDIQVIGIKVDIDEKKGVLRIPESTLSFKNAEDKVANKEAVLKIGSVLLKTLTEERFKGKVETVFVEGHTDDKPIYNERFKSNWELSAQRAINTWNIMCLSDTDLEVKKMLGENPSLGEIYANNKKLAKLQNIYYSDKEKKKISYSEYMFSCSGYAETRPIAPNDTDANQKLNRRIDIRFTMIPPSEEENPIVTEIEKEIQGGN